MNGEYRVVVSDGQEFRVAAEGFPDVGDTIFVMDQGAESNYFAVVRVRQWAIATIPTDKGSERKLFPFRLYLEREPSEDEKPAHPSGRGKGAKPKTAGKKPPAKKGTPKRTG